MTALLADFLRALDRAATLGPWQGDGYTRGITAAAHDSLCVAMEEKK